MSVRILIGQPWQIPPGRRVAVIGGEDESWSGFSRHGRRYADGTYDAVLFVGAEKLYRDRTKASDIAREVRRSVTCAWVSLDAAPRRPIDFWNLLDILQPGEWGSFWTFAARYCSPHKRALYRGGPSVYDFSGADNVEELHARLSKICVGLPPLASETSDEEDLRELGANLASGNYPFEDSYTLEDSDEQE